MKKRPSKSGVKTSSVSSIPSTESRENDVNLSDVAYILARLLVQVNPAIDEETTFELLMEMFERELSEQAAVRYGHLIRQTIVQPSRVEH